MDDVHSLSVSMRLLVCVGRRRKESLVGVGGGVAKERWEGIRKMGC